MSLLAQPLQIRGLTMPSRVVMAPMASKKATEDGRMTDDLVEYYSRRARAGGLGAIIVEHAFVEAIGRHAPNQLDATTDDAVGELAMLAETIHAPGTGTLALCQISHAGSIALPADLTGGLVAPSALIHPGRRRSGNTGIVPHALTREEIAGIVDSFAQAARRVACAGFDGVEVHGAHGYLLDEFFSPLTNLRGDEYGVRTVADRIRLTCEVVAAVRKAIGEDHILAVRVGPCDYAAGGATVADGVEAAPMLEEAGADIVDVSGGMYNFSTHTLLPPGFFRDSSGPIRQAVRVPVLTAGGVHEPQEAEWLLQTGACDLVGVGRSLMRQPAWAARALERLARIGDFRETQEFQELERLKDLRRGTAAGGRAVGGGPGASLEEPAVRG